MTRNTARAAFVAAALIVTAFSTAACATPVSPADGGDTPAFPLDVAVLGQGTVLQAGDEAPQFCLGGVLDSYPPQCSGPELVGWDWATTEGSETSNDVTWGTYAVWGDWDGERLTVTDSVMLALFDPMPFEDPFLDAANAGESSEADLLAAQEAIHEEAPVEVLTSWQENGYLFAHVVYDDGSVQAWADEQYGENVVQIRSALREVE
jgi:hypothetical protein